MIAAASAGATTIVMPSDEQLVAKAPVIVEGTVVRSVPVDRNGAIWTETTLRVERTIKGTAPETVTIAEIGGTLGDRFTKIYGGPDYREGERVLVFLRLRADGNYRTVDLFAGKFTEERMLNGRTLWFRDDAGADANLLDANFRPIEAKKVQRDAAGFESFVASRAAGEEASRNYGVENPVLDNSLPDTKGLERTSNFTLIDEPTIFRWAMFANGQTAAWRSHGTQPGYSGGGVNELNTAMNVWNNYSQAIIRYSYAGAGSGSPGGLSIRNNVNEVLFNDPLGEIDGSWTASAGGVVGQGGFNGTTNGGAWTAPFGADAQHAAGTYSSRAITEGNLTIQDGVSPSAGLSSSRLAEIIAHEFGHTLGFGHSADSSALMYYRVTGIGPSLRSDDQVAARWLYPSGTSTPPPPPTVERPSAPSALSGSASASSIALSWSDNASNETGQAIYLATATGSFGRTAEVAANARTATLSGFSAGTYRVYVTAFNSAGESSGSNTVTVTVGSGTPTNPTPAQAGFTVNPTTGIAGTTTFAFSDQSSGTITSRQWNFGDGMTSTSTNPARIYTNPGVYTVTLTVSGGGATTTATRSITVTGPLNGDFTFTPANPTTNDDVRFTDQSTGGVTSWLWNFGDGTSSSLQNPVKRYSQPGSYSVVMTIFRNAETRVAAKTIVVGAPAPQLPAVMASFDAPGGSVVAGSSVQFNDRSSGSPDRWQWNFGDGTSSALRNPSHAFPSAGTYTVMLTSANAASSSTAVRQVTVTAQLIPYHSVISATAQTTGVGGATWRTELNLFNAGAEATSVRLIYIPGAGGTLQTRDVFLSPRQAVTYANALLDVFALSSGAGALAIEATSATTSPDLRVSSRTFTGGSDGTYGQAVPEVAPEQLESRLYLTGLASNASFRTNVGLVNHTDSAAMTTLTLLDGVGVTIGTASINVPANNFQQSALRALFPQLVDRSDALSMRIVSERANAVSVYASVVDNRTQDPVYIQATPQPSGNSLIIPAVGRASGANGTFWRSDVTFFNPSSNLILLTIRYLAAGADNRNASNNTLSLNGGTTFVLADVLNTLGIQRGSGALEVTWSGAAPIVTSRTYTTAEGGGTFGQSIDPIGSYGRDVFVTGLRSDASFRSNIGFVNGSTETLGVNVSLLAASGATIASGFVQLQPKSQLQAPLSSLFPGVDAAAIGSFTLQAHTDGAAKLFAYGSIVDNASGDPVFFAGK
jgi:PKD repeat protein